jgi:regulator of cell morphogenesis and NO signaling
MVVEEAGLAPLFEKYGIDYCCGGDQTIDEACTRKGLDLSAVTKEIERIQTVRPYSHVHPELWDMEFLVDYIVQNHHRYCMETIPVLTTQLAKVSAVHGDRYPVLKQVQMLFQAAVQEIEQHMRKEEMILFPYLKSLSSAKDLGRLKPLAPFHTLFGPISRMEAEHEKISGIFFKIRSLLKNYKAPDSTCATQRAAIQGLEEFERDLHQHVHLENNILFPMALQFEKQLDVPYSADRYSTDRIGR